MLLFFFILDWLPPYYFFCQKTQLCPSTPEFACPCHILMEPPLSQPTVPDNSAASQMRCHHTALTALILLFQPFLVSLRFCRGGPEFYTTLRPKWTSIYTVQNWFLFYSLSPAESFLALVWPAAEQWADLPIGLPTQLQNPFPTQQSLLPRPQLQVN